MYMCSTFRLYSYIPAYVSDPRRGRTRPQLRSDVYDFHFSKFQHGAVPLRSSSVAIHARSLFGRPGPGCEAVGHKRRGACAAANPPQHGRIA